jgi:hypothetical protein
VLQTKNGYTLQQIWLESVKGLKRKNSYVAYVFRRVLNSRYTKSGLNRLRGKRVICFSLIELVVLFVELFNLVEIA